MTRAAQRSRVAAVFALAAVAPLFFSAGGDVLNNLVLAAAYVGMALGLNVIVGFAGLLDLGYVAFFAIGAYTAGYFGSGYWHETTVSVLVDGPGGLPGIHLNFLLVFVLAIVATAIAGGDHRRADAAPARRLHRDRHARLRRDRLQRRGQRRRRSALFGGTLTAGGRWASRRSTRWTFPFLAPVRRAEPAPVVLVRARARRVRAVCDRQPASARLAAGPRVVGAARGRGGRRQLRHPADGRTKLLAYGTGAGLGGLFGAFLASFLNTVTAVQFEFSFSIFILAMVVVGGLGSIWGIVAGAVILSGAQQLCAS